MLNKALLDQFKSFWNKTSKPAKYLTIISVCIPSFVLFRHLYWFIYRKYHSLPPGPNGIPIFGFFGEWNGGYESRINLSKKYGPIFYSTFPGQQVITLSTAKLMKKLFTQKQFLNHLELFNPKTDYYHSIQTFGKSNAHSFIMINGKKWTKRRKLSQDTLFRILNRANTGNLLKQTMEIEFSPFINSIIEQNKPWNNSREILRYITLNTIYSTIFNKRLGRDSKLFQTINTNLSDHLKNAALDAMVTKLPLIKVWFSVYKIL